MMKKSFLLFNLFPLMSALSLLSCGTNEQTEVFIKLVMKVAIYIPY